MLTEQHGGFAKASSPWERTSLHTNIASQSRFSLFLFFTFFPTMTFTLTNTTQHPDSGATPLSLDATSDQSAQDVKLVYPSAENDYRITTAIIPPGSKFHPGAHWHEDYDEVMRVAKGRAKIRLGKEWKIYGPEDGEVLIPKGTVHDLMRADVDAKPGEGDEGEVWVEERGEPGMGVSSCHFGASL